MIRNESEQDQAKSLIKDSTQTFKQITKVTTKEK